MPTNRRRRRANRRRNVELDDVSIFIMQTGHDFFGTFHDHAILTDRYDKDTDAKDAMCEFWRQHRDVILADWIQTNPGTRPWGWWEHDATERRRCVSGPHPHDLPDWSLSKELYYGKPRCIAGRYAFEAEYESEVDFLDRLGLLAPGELERAIEQRDRREAERKAKAERIALELEEAKQRMDEPFDPRACEATQ